MVAFVEHEQTKTGTPAIEVNVSRIVGCDGQRLDVVVAAADQSDCSTKSDEQLGIPLIQQVDRWRYNYRWSPGLLNRQYSEERLAGSCRQNDDAPASGVPPGRQPLHLMGEWIAAGSQRSGRELVLPGFVLVRDVLLAQVLDEGPVMDRFGPVNARPGI